MPHAWLRWYFADVFTYDFTSQQREIIDGVVSVLKHGGRKAIAASRGEGKTIITACLMLWGILSGKIKFGIIFSATGQAADELLEEIKERLATNDRIAADYPEVCDPVRELGDAPQRAGTMTATGTNCETKQPYKGARVKFSWRGDRLIFPRVPGSSSHGSILATRGLDSAFLGKRIGGRRPDFVMIDDPDTEESANSPTQTDKLTKRIKGAIAGLGGQRRGVGIVMVTTIHGRDSVSARFTEPKLEPAWRGLRFRFLVHPPDDVEAWHRYVEMLREDWRNGDELGRRAHQQYLDNMEAMNAGHRVANPNRFDPDKEASAIEHYYRFVAQNGIEAALTELDNDPPDATESETGLLRPADLLRRLSGYPRGVVPRGCTLVTQGIDCHGPGDPTRLGKSKGLVWVVVAWKPDGTAYVIDFGHTDWVPLTTRHTIEEAHAADDIDIPRALRRRRDEWLAKPPVDEAGNQVSIRATMIDTRYRTEAIVRTLPEIPGAIGWTGHGKSGGCVQSGGYNPPRNATVGDGWYIPERSREFHGNADRWKEFVHDRCRVTINEPSSIAFFDPTKCESEKAATAAIAELCQHICAEQIIEEPNKAGIVVRKFAGIDAGGRISEGAARVNHGLDALAMASAAANLLGIRLGVTIQPVAKRTTPGRTSARSEVLGAR